MVSNFLHWWKESKLNLLHIHAYVKILIQKILKEVILVNLLIVLSQQYIFHLTYYHLFLTRKKSKIYNLEYRLLFKVLYNTSFGGFFLIYKMLLYDYILKLNDYLFVIIITFLYICVFFFFFPFFIPFFFILIYILN